MKGMVAGLVFLGMAIGGPLPASGSETEKGKKVYEERRCGLCHAIAGQGGKIGPDLSNVGNQRDREWLMKFIKDPKGTMPGAKMLPVKAAEEEIAALAAYMLSLKR
jgi:cytochrome c2